jgi:hypothetical protein
MARAELLLAGPASQARLGDRFTAIAPAGIGVRRAVVIPFAAPDDAVPARDLLWDAVAVRTLASRPAQGPVTEAPM